MRGTAMIDYGLYGMIALYFIVLFIWMILLVTGYRKNIQVLDEKYLPRSQYPFRELLGIGLLLLKNARYESNRHRKKISQLKGAYGEKWGAFYYQINMAERVSYGLTLAMLGLLAVPASGEYLLLAVSPVLAAAGYFLAAGRVIDVVSKREEEILKQFPNVVSNLALLINSGMDTFNAWDNVAHSSEGLIYTEMRRTIQDMRTQGSSEIQAYIHFGSRCAVPRVTKFVSMLVQNIRKGSEDLSDFLAYESTVCWEEKKNRAKIQGEKAGNKLMIPIFMIMIGILVLIIGPLASNIGL